MLICWCLSWELIDVHDKRSIVANKKLTNKLYVNYLTIINLVDHSHAFLIVALFGPDQAALRLLDRFARDALQQARKEGYIKIATVLKDLADARTFWTANILVSSIDTDCNDKSG